MFGLPTVKKSERKPYVLSRNSHFARGTLYRLFVVFGELSKHISLTKGWPLSGHICVFITPKKVECMILLGQSIVFI